MTAQGLTDCTNFPELQFILSLRDGYVWASWPDAEPVNLGAHEVVVNVMRDFLAQDALGSRLQRLNLAKHLGWPDPD